MFFFRYWNYITNQQRFHISSPNQMTRSLKLGPNWWTTSCLPVDAEVSSNKPRTIGPLNGKKQRSRKDHISHHRKIGNSTQKRLRMGHWLGGMTRASPFCVSFSRCFATCNGVLSAQSPQLARLPATALAAASCIIKCVEQRNTIQEFRKWPKLNHLVIVAKILQNTHRKNDISGRLEDTHYICCFPVPNLVPVCIVGLKKHRSCQIMPSHIWPSRCKKADGKAWQSPRDELP